MALDVTGDLGVWFSDFALSATYQAMVDGAPSGAPIACAAIDAMDGQFVSVGHVPAAQYNRLFWLRPDQVASPQEGGVLTVDGTAYTISAPPRFSDATRTLWVVPVR